MKKTIQDRLNIGLADWAIVSIGMVDRQTYLVVANWSNEDKKFTDIKPSDNKDYDHWTALLIIDLKSEKIDRKVIFGGLSKTHCDGGIINGNKEAFFGASQGITYHLDYGKDTFEHEELMGTSKRIEDGTARGIRDIKLLGNHFYSAFWGIQVHRRDAAKKWTLISHEPKEYFKKLGNSDVSSLDGFSEQELYFCGEEGNLWYFDGLRWEKIFGFSKDIDFDYLVCGDDKVYVVDSLGGVAVGRHNKFTHFPTKSSDDMNAILYAVTYFNGKLYGSNHSIYQFENNKWVEADIPEVYGSVEYLASKDGVMFIATPYSLKLYNGKETFTLYGGEKEEARLMLNEFLQSSQGFIEGGNELLNELGKSK
jgi:hypothetical protein